MFQRLRTRLTVLYAGLFAGILALISVGVYAAVSQNATQFVRAELMAGGQVFDRVWAQRSDQLSNDARLLSHDFGFLQAVATHDDPTVASALQNLKVRLGIDHAFLITPDGRVTIAGGDHAVALDAPTLAALQDDDGASGLLVIDGAPYEVVSVPVSAPTTIGWVVFAARLDRQSMHQLEGLAAIPMTASVVWRDTASAWRDEGGPERDRSLSSLISRTYASTAAGHALAPDLADINGESSMALAKPLTSIDPRHPVVLLLHYPMAKALAPFRLLIGLFVLAAAAGMAALLFGAGAIARSVTQPISALQDAVRRLQQGEQARAVVTSRDEIGDLAGAFNTMAAEIGARERDLAAARDLAQAANRAKSSFLANMSHEVRTPLNGVLGVAGVLAGTQLTDDQRRMVGIIENSASGLQRVLSDVLDLARVEAGRMDLIDEDFDLGAALRAMADSAEVQCQGRDLVFRLDAADANGAAVRADRARLEQILGNLISNAVKFTETGAVTLTAEREGDDWRFAVRDTGIGFDPSIAEALFRPFQQADGSNTRKFGGTGLGLSISRELARMMGGELTCDSRPGEGSIFELHIPLPAGVMAPNAEPPANVAPEAGEGPPLRVLLADDHETNRVVVQLILNAAGVDLVSVEDGAQAVDAYKAGAFDLVLMDMQMPVMDGLTAIRQIRVHEAAAGRRIPILVLSANAMPEHVEAAHAAGADAHVAKPITPPKLLAAIDAALAPPQISERAAS